MGRNDYTKTILMLLCFGTAFVSLAMHWHSQNGMQRMMSSNSSNSPNPSKPNPSRQVQTVTSPTDAHTGWWPQFLRIEQPSQASSNQPVRTYTPKKSDSESKNKLATNSTAAINSAINKINNTHEAKVIVDLSDRRVYVYRFGQVIASYPTGIGKRGWETPIGSYQVIHMEHDPIWKHPITGKVYPAGKPDSPLGARWIGFHSTTDGEIGFHGTPDEELVGSPISHGCLRMRNGDVKLFYAQVKLGTPVEVRQ